MGFPPCKSLAHCCYVFKEAENARVNCTRQLALLRQSRTVVRRVVAMTKDIRFPAINYLIALRTSSSSLPFFENYFWHRVKKAVAL